MKYLIQMTVAVLLGAFSTAATAHDYTLGDLKIDHPHARVTIPGRPAAGYMMIHNTGDKDDAVISASSPMADKIELHTHLMENNVMKMRPVEKVAVPAKGMAEFKSGGFHLMIFGLKHQMKAGDALPVTLVFEKAGSLKLDFKVETLGAKKQMNHDSHSGHGPAKHH